MGERELEGQRGSQGERPWGQAQAARAGPTLMVLALWPLGWGEVTPLLPGCPGRLPQGAAGLRPAGCGWSALGRALGKVGDKPQQAEESRAAQGPQGTSRARPPSVFGSEPSPSSW